jgi:tRNA A37 methylthiotransferase MiaB
MDGQLPKHVKRQRAAELARVETQLRDRYFESLLGRRLSVLAEATSNSTDKGVSGTSCRYAPVDMAADHAMIGRFVTVVAREIHDGRILGIA